MKERENIFQFEEGLTVRGKTRERQLPLYHISNYRTPLKPTFHDWRNLSDLPNEHEKEYCWKCGFKTKQMNCPNCHADKFYMTNK